MQPHSATSRALTARASFSEWRRRWPQWRFKSLGSTILLADTAMLLPMAMSSTLALSCVLLVAIGTFAGFRFITVTSWLQLYAQRAMTGRVMSVFMLIIFGIGPRRASSSDGFSRPSRSISCLQARQLCCSSSSPWRERSLQCTTSAPRRASSDQLTPGKRSILAETNLRRSDKIMPACACAPLPQPCAGPTCRSCRAHRSSSRPPVPAPGNAAPRPSREAGC